MRVTSTSERPHVEGTPPSHGPRRIRRRLYLLLAELADQRRPQLLRQLVREGAEEAEAVRLLDQALVDLYRRGGKRQPRQLDLLDLEGGADRASESSDDASAIHQLDIVSWIQATDAYEFEYEREDDLEAFSEDVSLVDDASGM